MLASLDAFLGDGRLRSGWEGMQAARLVPCQLFGRIAPCLLLACLKIDAAYGRDYRRVT